MYAHQLAPNQRVTWLNTSDCSLNIGKTYIVKQITHKLSTWQIELRKAVQMTKPTLAAAAAKLQAHKWLYKLKFVILPNALPDLDHVITSGGSVSNICLSTYGKPVGGAAEEAVATALVRETLRSEIV
jgi:hypothetical protein